MAESATARYVPVPVPFYPAGSEATSTASESAREASADQTAVSKRTTDQQDNLSLGYHSITYTPSEDPQESILLSELIKISRKNPLLPDSDGCLIDNFYKWAVITKNYWLSVKTIKPACKCIPGKFWGYTHEARPLHNRFSHSRRKWKLAKVHEIMRHEEMLGTKEFTLLSLTASHEGGWRATMDRLILGRNRLLKIIRKYFQGFRYIWVGEPHTDKDHRGGDIGYPHFHIVIAGRVDNTILDSEGRGLEDKLRDYWSDKWDLGSHTFGLNFEVIDNREKALNYILKYVGKSFTNERGWSAAELIFNANLYGAMSDEENPKKYRTFGMCNEYNKLFPHKAREPSVCLDARLFPIIEENPFGDEDSIFLEKSVVLPRQLIPDWLGNINLIESILKGPPDYTTRPKYDPKGKPLAYLPNHWGRPCEGLR